MAGMGKGRAHDRDLAGFAPRVTIMVLGSLLLFTLLAGLYVLPVLLEPPPPGAIPDYTQQRVMAQLEGKTLWILCASFLSVAGLAIRGILPGTGRRS
jgi:hypothetical protein